MGTQGRIGIGGRRISYLEVVIRTDRWYCTTMEAPPADWRPTSSSPPLNPTG